MLTFLLLSCVVAVLLLVHRTRLNLAMQGVMAVLVCAVGAALWFIFVPEHSILLKGDILPWWDRTPWKDVLLFCAMVLGMSAKYLWDLIEVRKIKNANLKPGDAKVGIEYDFWDFLQPLLVATIVFAGVLSAVKEFSATSYLFSFQNGFFWQAILKQKTLTGIDVTAA